MWKFKRLPAVLASLLLCPAVHSQTRELDFAIDATLRDETVRRSAEQIEKRYFNERLAREMAARLRERLSGGAYADILTAAALGEAVTTDLRSVSRDGHVQLRWSSRALPNFDPDRPPPPPPPGAIEEQRRLMAMLNGFVTDAVWLPGNVGYLALDAFGNPDDMKQPLARAMALLANTDALIIDMRTNKGGSPAGVALLASYLFGETPVHLNDLVSPRQNRTEPFFTSRDLDGPRYGIARRVYVLTSKATYSAPEEFAYDLQALKRATIVGEVTGGGANPAAGFPVNEHFLLAIPIAEARNPVTGTNWEGVGVTPDVAVDADSAKAAAYLLALLHQQGRTGTPEFIRAQIDEKIGELMSQLPQRDAAAAVEQSRSAEQ